MITKFKTVKLAYSKGFTREIMGYSNTSIRRNYYTEKGEFNGDCSDVIRDILKVGKEEAERKHILYPAPTQEQVSKFIRENRGVHIEVRRNASGYFWEMCKSDGGTDLGWSDYTGPNMGGTWDTYEDALENALQVQLNTDLEKIKNHWSNYSEFAIKTLKLK